MSGSDRKCDLRPLSPNARETASWPLTLGTSPYESITNRRFKIQVNPMACETGCSNTLKCVCGSVWWDRIQVYMTCETRYSTSSKCVWLGAMRQDIIVCIYVRVHMWGYVRMFNINHTQKDLNQFRKPPWLERPQPNNSPKWDIHFHFECKICELL